MLARAYPLSLILLPFTLAVHAQAAPEMFAASFIFHAWSNDISSGTASPFSEGYATAAPLGYNCQHAEPWTTPNQPIDPHYCTDPKMERGHPVSGLNVTPWGRGVAPDRSIGTGTPPKITLMQSDIGVYLYTDPIGTGTPPGRRDSATPHCCRGFLITFPPYTQSTSYATFVNAPGSFFAGGGCRLRQPDRRHRDGKIQQQDGQEPG
jgi:hypothetical protein